MDPIEAQSDEYIATLAELQQDRDLRQISIPPTESLGRFHVDQCMVASLDGKYSMYRQGTLYLLQQHGSSINSHTMPGGVLPSSDAHATTPVRGQYLERVYSRNNNVVHNMGVTPSHSSNLYTDLLDNTPYLDICKLPEPGCPASLQSDQNGSAALITDGRAAVLWRSERRG